MKKLRKNKRFWKQNVLTCLLIFLLHFGGFAQTDDECPEVSKKAKKIYDQAMHENSKGQNELAYRLLIDAVKEDETFARAYLALAKINLRRSETTNDPAASLQLRNRALDYFRKVVDHCPSADNFYACFELGKRHYIAKEYEKAKPFIDKYLAGSKPAVERAEAEVISKHINEYYKLKANPVPFNPVKVDGLSSADDEFLPLISPDGELAFFTHRYSKYTSIGTKVKTDEFSVAEKTGLNNEKNPVFGKIKTMATPFNANPDNNQGAVSITIDNNHLFVTICENNIYCDVWVSDYEYGEWTPLKNLGSAINGRRSWESQPSISSDGKNLYFASIRPGNLGFDLDDETTHTSDIWVSNLDKNGNWLPAKNLGSVINTHGSEKSPFIHSDSQTLYFSSDGRDGLGGYDIYYSKMKPEGTWSEPVNIGYPINTEGDEIGFIVSTDGKKAYFSSNKLEGSNGWDIYTFDLYKEARPKEVLIAKGDIKDDQGEPVENAKVEVKNTATNKVTEGIVDKISGRYAVALQLEKPDDEFIMTVKKENYAFTSEYIKVKEIKTGEPAKVNFEVKPVEVGATVKLNNIYFETNQPVFEKSSLIVLDNFLEYLEENKNIKISIHGHTDDVGNDEDNQQLSEARAKAVSNYLILQGLDKSRIISSKGFGEKKPVAGNTTPEGRALNRRTEFVIEGK